MKRILLLFSASFLFHAFSYSQDLTQYVGKGKMYHLPSWNTDLMYCATDLLSSETLYGEQLESNSLYLYENSSFVNYTSSHGNYIEITHSQYFAGARCYGISKGFLFYAWGYGLCAFTVKGKNLYLIGVQSDAIVSIIDSNFSRGSDFSILVRDDSNPGTTRYEPSIWIINNGYIKVFNNITNIVSNIKERKSENIDSKMFTLGGIETYNPHNEIIVQDGVKKYIP